MADFSTIESIYRFLTPEDLYGRLRLSFGEVKIKSADTLLTLNNNYVNTMFTGENIIKNLKDIDEKGKGYLYNTITQTGSGKLQFLDENYWKEDKKPNPKTKNFPKGITSSAKNNAPKEDEDSKSQTVNSLSQIIHVDIPENISVTINVLRLPLVSPSRKNTDEVQIFLNNIPSTFASQMVPYFDLEFQLPVPATESSQGVFLNRPTLLRFLDGSIDLINTNLTEADKSLTQISPTPTLSQPESYAYFSGMEMFTTPQTLVNMKGLNANADRLNPVKPFLPLASITGASIQIQNAGTGKFAHKTAKVEIKIHDKARLVEFSEFVRGPAGYRDLTLWLTYGWLAPRGRGENDVFAKFINENMLTREAFSVKNSSFSFDAVGQVSISLELVSKGFATIEKSTIDSTGGNLKNIQEDLRRLIARIRENRSAFGNDVSGFNQEIRIFQILDSAAAGDLNLDVQPAEIKSQLDALRKSLENNKRMTDQQKKKATILIGDVEQLYGTAQGSKSLKERISAAASEFAKNAFDNCASDDSMDPFLPHEKKVEDAKKNVKQKTSEPEKDEKPEEKPIKLYTNNLLNEIKKYSGSPGVNEKLPSFKKRVVSFGKIFSTFCLPSLISVAQKELIDEVQINFYGLNESCGPVSLCSIAEFPIDVSMLADQFSELAAERGGDSLMIQEFLKFCIDSQFGDNRAIGYGMRDFYEPYDSKNKEEKLKANSAELAEKQSKWFINYGSFKQPDIAIKIETLSENESSFSKVDLLYKLKNSAANLYQNVPKKEGKKLIKRIHIYDKQLNPYYEMAKIFRATDDASGDWLSIEQRDVEPTEQTIKKRFTTSVLEATQKKNTTQKPGSPKINVEVAENNLVKVSLTAGDGKNEAVIGQIPTTRIQGGKNMLRDLVASSIPTITYGVNSTLVYNASLSSKADGLLGTINMQGGSFKAKSTLSPNGLAMADHNIPMRIIPAQLSMSTAGCPIADLYQNYFIDFGTGTTLDNLYVCTQLIHNFSPGKFDTNWTFVFTDGYGRFFGAAPISSMLKELQQSVEENIEPKNK